MGKFLRHISADFTDADGRPDQAAWAALHHAPEVWHLPWMFEHNVTPMRTDGVAKVNIFFTSELLCRDPSDVMEIAAVYEYFDIQHFLSLTPKGRQHYYLGRFQAAMLRCAAHFGWNTRPLTDTYRQMIEDDFQFSFFWKKPLSSPDRQKKVQAFVEASPLPARLYLVFFGRDRSELSRTLLSIGCDGTGPVEFALGKIQWLDSQTVRVQNKNGRDFWLCTSDGCVEFHYPRAECGDPHGEYDLGKMYYEGRLVLQDRARGLGLIKSAAEKGFQHATRFLANQETSDTDSGQLAGGLNAG